MPMETNVIIRMLCENACVNGMWQLALKQTIHLFYSQHPRWRHAHVTTLVWFHFLSKKCWPTQKPKLRRGQWSRSLPLSLSVLNIVGISNRHICGLLLLLLLLLIKHSFVIWKKNLGEFHLLCCACVRPCERV